MNKYDEAIRIWIARSYGKVNGRFITADQISDIKWGQDGGYYYSSYTFAEDEAVLRFKVNGKDQYMMIEYHSPVKLIEECMKIYNEVLKHVPESY